MAEIIKKGKIKRKNGSNVEVLLPFTTEDQVENLVSDLAGKIADPVTKAEGNFLRYDGSDWVAANIPDTGVLSVSAITDSGIKVDNTDAANPKVGIASTHKLPTTTEWNGNIVTVGTEKSGKIEIGGVSKQVMPDNLVVDANYKHIEVTSTSVSDGTNTFNKYDDTALAGRVSTIEGDYLKAADKTELQSAIDGKVAKTQKVNGKALLGDITIYGSDIEADSSTSTKLIGSDHKVPLSLLPDAILGQLMYGGNVEKVDSDIIAYPTANLQAKLGITDTEIKLVNSATDDTTKTPKEYGYKTLQGAYFIARNEFEVEVGTERVVFQKGDWLIGAGTYWDKIDNTDAVTSVNGQTGAVVLDYEDVGAQAAFTDGSAKVADITSDVMSIYGVTQSGGAIGNGSKVGDVYTKGKVDTLLGGYVPTSRKVNGHALTGDVTVTAGDIGLSVSATNGVTLGDVTYKYSHPTHTAAAEGLYKVQVNDLGHIIKTTAVLKTDFTDGFGLADDSLVAHLAGVETFTGKKTFTGDVELPVNVKIGSLTSTGLVKYTNGVLSVDQNNYITENQTITVTGDATGSGKTSIALTLANSGVTAGTYSAVQVNAKGLVTSGGQMIDVIAYGGTPNVVDGGWYFEENQA